MFNSAIEGNEMADQEAAKMDQSRAKVLICWSKERRRVWTNDRCVKVYGEQAVNIKLEDGCRRQQIGDDRCPKSEEEE